MSSRPHAYDGLRSSCRYCRRRKIKCHGQSPCSACSSRRLDCVFEKMAKMGRPTHSSSSSPFDSNLDIDCRTLGDAFLDIYEEMFRSRLPTSAFSVALQSYMKDKAPYLVYGPEDLQEQKPCTPAVYDGLMPMLVQDMIQTCKYQYSALGKSGDDSDRKPSYLAIALSRDDDTLPFTSTQPQSQIDDIQISPAETSSLSQTWFASHPLSQCVTIADTQADGSLNKALFSLVACEASSLLGLQHSEQLLDQAHRIFYSTRLPNKDDIEGMFLACKISTLLGWRHTAHTRVKWGIASLALSCQLMAQIESKKECQGAVLSNLKSFLSIFTVWSFAQLGRSSGCLSVANDPIASPLSQFYSTTAQTTSLLLNNHPDILGINMNKLEDVDFGLLCQQLRSSFPPLSAAADSKGAMDQAVQHILMLSLLFPRKTLLNNDYPQRASEVLFRCNVSLSLLIELANVRPSGNEDTVPMLSKLTFRRPAPISGDMMAMNCTVASLLYITIAEALEALVDLDTTNMYWSLVADLSRRVLDTPMSLVLETEDIKQSRNILLSLSRGKSENVSPNESIDWLEDVLPSLSSSTYETPSDHTESESDLINCLWGELQWDMPLDALAAKEMGDGD